MRIGYVVKEFPKISETFIAREILELERQGLEVTVLSLRPSQRAVPHGWLGSLRAAVVGCESRQSFSRTWKELKTHASRNPERREDIRTAVLEAFDCPMRSGRSYLVEATAVAEAVEERGLQHLHAHFANHPTFVAMLAHLITGIPYSFTAHAKDIYAAGPVPALWRSQIERAEFAVTVSEANRQYITSIVGTELGRKVRSLYNGIDLQQIRPVRARPNAIPRLLFVGRLIEKKGADLLIDALALLRDRGIDAMCTLVGDGEEAAALQDQIARHSLNGSVHLASTLSHERVIEELQRADVFALPCRIAADGDRDALPTVLLEAMAAGVPAVSTPVNGVPEIIEHGETGLLVPENDAAELAVAIGTLLDEPLLRRKMALAARRRAARLFSARRNVDTLRQWIVGDPVLAPAPDRRAVQISGGHRVVQATGGHAPSQGARGRRAVQASGAHSPVPAAGAPTVAR